MVEFIRENIAFWTLFISLDQSCRLYCDFIRLNAISPKKIGREKILRMAEKLIEIRSAWSKIVV